MKRRAISIPVTDLIGALSEAIRLRVLRLLEAEELSVGEVAKVVQLPQSTISRHLKTLSDGGWLTKRSAGTATLYRLVLDDMSVGARSLWVAVRSQMDSLPELQEDERRLASVLAERRLDSQAFFGRVAGEWDAVRTRLFGASFTAAGLLALLRADWVVADLGCGTGNASELLAPHVERVIALDQSEPMLEAAKRRLGATSNIQFATGELGALPLKDRSVDAAVCVLVLHHMERPIEALREMRRVLRADRTGGVALVIDMMQHDRDEYRHTMGHTHLGFSAATIRGMFREAGFTNDVRVAILPSDPEGKGPGLFAASVRI
jgi:ArsR family transcriptional regulator